MSKEGKDRLISWIGSAIISFGCVFIAYGFSKSDINDAKLDRKADITYVDKQNEKQDEITNKQNEKQDERIDKQEDKQDDMYDMILDIWKARGLDKK